MPVSSLWTDTEVEELTTVLRDTAVPPAFMTHLLDKSGVAGATVSSFLDRGVTVASELSASNLLALYDRLPKALQHGIDQDALKRADDHEVRLLVEKLAVEATQDQYSDLIPYAREDGYFSRSRVLEAYPELTPSFDNDKLLRCEPGVKVTPWFIEYKKSALHYSPFLRQGFRSNVNLDLSNHLAKVRHNEPNMTLRLAIDHGRLGSPESVFQIEEKAYWYGPNLDPGWLDDPANQGVTVHGYEDSHDNPRFPCRKMEVRRYVDKNDNRLKVIEIEEVVDPELRSITFRLGDWDFVPNRYIHAIRDMQRRVMVHFDAAVRIYSRDRYSRVNESFGHSAFNYVKVFRMDGEFSEQTWADITTAYFRDNTLIFEVLGRDGIGQ